MTFVGKILVILIMVLSLVFLGVSTVAFVTATNWKEETAKQTAAVKKASGQAETAKAAQRSAEAALATAKEEFAAADKAAQGRIKSLDDDNNQAQAEITRIRTQLTDAQANAKLAVDEAQARTAEMTALRDQLSAAVDQGNKLKIEQTELNTQILTLNRSLAASERTAKELRELSAKAIGRLQQLGVSTDLSRMHSTSDIPSDVEGKVTKYDVRRKAMELSIGADDGVFVGMELFLYRTEPTAEYLGKVKVTAVDPDQSVAAVIGNTVHGKPIKEGDNVSSTLRSK